MYVYKLEVKINFEFKKGVGIATKSKETSSLLASHLTNSYHSPASVTYRYYMCLVKYNCSWVAIHSYTNETHPPARLQDLIPTLAGIHIYIH